MAPEIKLKFFTYCTVCVQTLPGWLLPSCPPAHSISLFLFGGHTNVLSTSGSACLLFPLPRILCPKSFHGWPLLQGVSLDLLSPERRDLPCLLTPLLMACHTPGSLSLHLSYTPEPSILSERVCVCTLYLPVSLIDCEFLEVVTLSHRGHLALKSTVLPN